MMPVRAQGYFIGGAEILAFAKEDSWADCDLRGVARPVAAVAEGDGEHCSKFRSDAIQNGTSCTAKRRQGYAA